MSNKSKDAKRSMKLGGFLGKLKKNKKVEEEHLDNVEDESKQILTSESRYLHKLYSIKPGYKVIDTYPIYEPYAYINIVEDPEGKLIYEVQEVSLTPEEEEIYKEIKDHIVWELKPVVKLEVDVANEIRRLARRIMKEFQIRFTRTPGLSWSKIMYYVDRDIIGYGILDPIFKDRHIEDISCNGPKKPVYVWHRKYESLPTNIEFLSEEELDEYILKLTHMAGKHISVAYPILDAILPGGHRLAATFRKEVST
ncbi:MAG: protein kinase, partial [Ignisphaera sp.]